jgi:hypothetical protein
MAYHIKSPRGAEQILSGTAGEARVAAWKMAEKETCYSNKGDSPVSLFHDGKLIAYLWSDRFLDAEYAASQNL